VAYWKSTMSRQWPRPEEHPIWQKDMWDAQMRNSTHYHERWEYVRNNPLRQGLVSTPKAWRFAGELKQFRFTNR